MEGKKAKKSKIYVRYFVTDPFASPEEKKAAEAARKAKEAEDKLPRKLINVTVLKGRDLTKMDFAFKGGGKSDPYVLVKFGKEKNKSEVIKKNLNPTWNYNCVVGKEKRVTKTFLGNGGGQMTFEVYDWDQVGADDKVRVRSSFLIKVWAVISSSINASIHFYIHSLACTTNNAHQNPYCAVCHPDRLGRSMWMSPPS